MAPKPIFLPVVSSHVPWWQVEVQYLVCPQIEHWGEADCRAFSDISSPLTGLSKNCKDTVARRAFCQAKAVVGVAACCCIHLTFLFLLLHSPLFYRLSELIADSPDRGLGIFLSQVVEGEECHMLYNSRKLLMRDSKSFKDFSAFRDFPVTHYQDQKQCVRLIGRTCETHTHT